MSKLYPHHGLCTLTIGQGVIGKNLIFALHRPITATSSANCGIISNDLDNALHKGLPPFLNKLLHEMGRVDRKLSAKPGECHYEVHILFNSCISLYIRIMSTENISERKRLLDEIMLVIELLTNSKECYHYAISRIVLNRTLCQTNHIVTNFVPLVMERSGIQQVYSIAVNSCQSLLPK